jgi:hypothetical protein
MPKGFDVRIDGGSAVDAGDDLTHLFSGLTASTEYDIEVRKRDAAGSVSAWSSIVSQTTQAASGGAALTYNNTLAVTTEVDGGVLKNGGAGSYAHSIETIASSSTDRFTFNPVAADLTDSGLVIGLVAAANVPATTRVTNVPFYVEMFGANVWLSTPGGVLEFSTAHSGMTTLGLGFNGSGLVRLYKNGTQVYQTFDSGSGNYHLRVWIDSGYPNGNGVSAAIKE